MRLIDLPDIRQQVRQLQAEQQFATADDPVQLDTIPATKPAQAKLLKDLAGKWAISQSPAVFSLLVWAGWSHRGLYGADVYWRR